MRSEKNHNDLRDVRGEQTCGVAEEKDQDHGQVLDWGVYQHDVVAAYKQNLV